jgi:nicotinamidase-related amidase
MAALGRAVFSPSDPGSPLSVPASQTALVLMDYQNMVLARLGEAGPSVVNIARQMRDWALVEKSGMAVFHCLIDTNPGVAPPARNKLSSRWKMYEEKLAGQPWLGRETPELATTSGGGGAVETFFRTPGLVSVLESTGLMQEIERCNIQSLILCGISTSGCVLSTARAATDRGFVVTVVEDACFDPVPGLHHMLVSHVLPATAHVAMSGEIRDAWKVL